MDVQEEFVQLLAEEVDIELKELVFMLKMGYVPKTESWIIRGSSPFPNQDRHWKTTWTKEY